MRDPDRIRPFLEKLEKLWLENPDWRFGQLVMNLCRPGEGLGFLDPWNWEELFWLEKIEAARKSDDTRTTV